MKLIKVNVRRVQLLLLFFFAIVFWINCKSQNLYTKIYESSGEYYIYSLSELRDSSIVLHTRRYDTLNAAFYHINDLGDSINKFIASPPIWGAWHHTTFSDSLICVAVQSQNGIHGIQSAIINPYTWNISNITTYAVLGFAYPLCVYRAKNGDLLVGSYGPNTGNFGLIRTDSSFNVKWTQACPGGARLILEDSLGNIITAGENGSQVLQPFRLNYFDSLGNVIWSKSYGNNVSFTGNILTVGLMILPDSNFVIIGESGGYPEYGFAKIDRATGDTLLTRILSYCCPDVALQISGDNIFTASNKGMNFYNSNGDLLYSKALPPGLQNDTFGPRTAIRTMDGGIAIAGVVVPDYNNSSVRLPAIIKVDTLGNGVPLSLADFEKINSQFTVYPNPVSGELHFYLPALLAQQDVTMSVYDATGRLVISSNQVNKCENETCTLDCSTLNNGFYSMVIQGKEGRYWRKFVVER